MLKNNRMIIWILKSFLFAIVFMPSFTLYFNHNFNEEIIKGLTYWKLLYCSIAILTVYILTGSRVLILCLTAVSLLSISVIFFGSIISCLINFSSISNNYIFSYSPRYISLLINMYTVVPLAIAFMSILPFKEYENYLLRRFKGISLFEKILLIITRVFNHIIYYVAPNILRVIKEEKRNNDIYYSANLVEEATVKNYQSIRLKFRKLLIVFFDLSLCSICFSIEYVPLWVLEISNLPSKKKFKEIKNER